MSGDVLEEVCELEVSGQAVEEDEAGVVAYAAPCGEEMDVAGFLATETGSGEEGGDGVSEKGLPGLRVGGYANDGGGKTVVFFRLEQVTDGAELYSIAQRH